MNFLFNTFGAEFTRMVLLANIWKKFVQYFLNAFG